MLIRVLEGDAYFRPVEIHQLTDLNDFLAREVTGGKKNCSECIFLKNL